MTPPLCDWLDLSITITTSLKWAGGEEQREKSCVDSIRCSVFSCADLPPFRAVNSSYSQNDFVSRYVCYCWVCLHAGECFLFKR